MMDLSNKNVTELINIALNTSSLNEMRLLIHNPYMNIRRSLAKNIHITEEILEILISDPVENVSYVASIHPKINNKYEMKTESACVLCEVDERHLNCTSCLEGLKHSF
jgi:hypothetical protein